MLKSLCCRRQGVSLFPGECPESECVSLTSSSRLHFWVPYLLTKTLPLCCSGFRSLFPSVDQFLQVKINCSHNVSYAGVDLSVANLTWVQDYWLWCLKFSHYVVRLACFHQTQNRIGKSKGSGYGEQVQRWRARKLAGPEVNPRDLEKHGFSLWYLWIDMRRLINIKYLERMFCS